MIFGIIGGFVVGLVIGSLATFDWKAYFEYKKDVTELVMKYKSNN